jgi:adenine-specific DNA-methyltransferase
MVLDHPYLTSQLIAYIGNKRALLGFLADVLRELEGESRIETFLDPFAGSGAVSRLAKYLGYRVLCNDWEPYSRVINSAHVGIDRGEANGYFDGGLERALEDINRSRAEVPAYIARYYAPGSTENADYRRERLFYTAENAAFIDRSRHLIEERYHGWDLDERDTGAKTLLLASLLYQAATHANTSGVFKAFHKGFGGHGKDALKRITAPMKLNPPVLIDGAPGCEAGGEDARDFVMGRTVDLCYLDPPYNQHQYGSNYHLLNTILHWDKPEYPLDRGEDGRLRDKAGIRRDWTRTRSGYCYRETAGKELADLLDRIDSRHILLSYNTEGIIPFDDLVELLADHGELSLYSSDYVTYRGGRQSISKEVHNAEFLLVLRRGRKTSPEARSRIRRFRKERRVSLLLKGTFHPRRIEENRRDFPETVRFVLTPGAPCRLDVVPSEEDIAALDEGDLDRLITALERSRFEDYREECLYLVEILAGVDEDDRLRRRMEHRFIRILKKIAHRKYRESFSEVVDSLRRRVPLEEPRFLRFTERIEEVERIAELRIRG